MLSRQPRVQRFPTVGNAHRRIEHRVNFQGNADKPAERERGNKEKSVDRLVNICRHGRRTIQFRQTCSNARSLLSFLPSFPSPARLCLRGARNNPRTTRIALESLPSVQGGKGDEKLAIVIFLITSYKRSPYRA